MFDRLMPNREEKMMKESEERQKAFSREQLSFQAGVVDDQIALKQYEERNDLLKWQQDLNDEAIALIHKLKREVQIDGEWKKMKRLVGYRRDNNEPVYEELPPYMNEIGISMVVDQCGPLLSRNLINSNLSEDRILKILEETSNAIADNLADYYDVYETEFTNFDVIIRLVKNTIIAAPFRALNGWNKKVDSTVNKRIEAFHEGIAPSKKKFGLI